MNWFNEYTEPNDPLDNPKYEIEYHQEFDEYQEKLDDIERFKDEN